MSDAILKRTSWLFQARVPAGIVAMVGSGTCFALGMSADHVATLMGWTCAGMSLVGLEQVVLWSLVQETPGGAEGM